MRWVAFALLVGCRYTHGVVPVADVPVDIIAIDTPIDVKPPDPRECVSAPTGCKVFTCAGSTSCYYVCGNTTNLKYSWSGAVTSCMNASLGCIVTINDQAEQDCITAETTPTFQSFVWFGFRQSAGGAEPDQGWGWQCGTSTYLPGSWGQSEPNNQGDEDCAAMTTGGGWFDADCGGTARMVCELP